jgi:hypothetical protein
MVYVIAIKNLLKAEFSRVVPVSMLHLKDSICCQAHDVAECESRLS